MIYPAFQKPEITGWIDFSPSEIEINGFDSDYALSVLNNHICGDCKGNALYINIIKENSRRLEYVEEARRLTGEKYIITSEKTDGNLVLTVTVSCREGIFRAVNRIVQMIKDKKFFVGTVTDYPLFAVRGYLEGFYGKPWTNENRRMMLELMSFYGMNTYYYAPKDDPYHRDKWSELYPENELSALSELAALCREKFVKFHYCIAPGLSMKYSSEEDFDKLICKAEQLYSIGIRNFGLLVDDIPEDLWFDEDKAAFDGEAVNAHIDLSDKFRNYLKEKDDKCTLTVCPLQYHGRGDEYYISKLGQGISGDIDIFWTGKNICSQEITVREAVIFENSTNRQPLYWDNFPVNDAEMYNEMHTGYLNGREADLYRYSRGIVSNTMEYALSSRIPLLTVCDYLWNPVSYDGFESWQKACKIILGEEKELFMPLLDNLLTSCLKVENSPMLNETLNLAQQQFFSGDVSGAAATVSAYIEALEKCCSTLQSLDNPMVLELEPWLEKQNIALDLIKSSLMILSDNSEENKSKSVEILKRYLAHPRTLCDFSLQAFAERMLTL
ncbi:MAG: beta-N-acetylglucosaminidase domain-containing protein [Clostridia bacterium]|nr:beta-N-acetylglucosaminidase domain-containing protein [Clostridia bacterium]